MGAGHFTPIDEHVNFGRVEYATVTLHYMLQPPSRPWQDAQ